jgi:hypothetical protein
MIRVPSPIPEPAPFDTSCRQAGRQWLQLRHQNQQPLPDRPRDFWSPFRPDLRRGFGGRCGYYAMYIHDGQVDHLVSWNTCRTNNTPELAYEWDNFRFVDGALNSSKRTLDGQLLDPFEVGDDWFELELPSLLLRPVSVPADRQDAARLTLERLELDQGLRVLELRWEWYDKHQRGLLTLDGLRAVAPLLARAVERWHSDCRGELPVIPRPVPDPYDDLV